MVLPGVSCVLHIKSLKRGEKEEEVEEVEERKEGREGKITTKQNLLSMNTKLGFMTHISEK